MSALNVLLSFFFLSVSLSVQAQSQIWAERLENSTVKVQSGSSRLPDRHLEGSGLLFQMDQDYFVLTSEHVVLHEGTKPYFHRIWSSKLGVVDAQLVKADWLTGLALLKLPIQIKGKLSKLNPMKLDEFAPVAPDQAKLVSFCASGFPHSVWDLRQDFQGRSLSFESERHLFPGLNKVIELRTHAEFGMSGGPVADLSSQKVVGFLSHQFIERKLGGSGIVKQLSDLSGMQEQIVAIPADFAKAWVKSIKTIPDMNVFQRDPQAQLFGRDLVHSQGFQILSRGGGEGAGIGGADGSTKSNGPTPFVIELKSTSSDFIVPNFISRSLKPATLLKLENALRSAYQVQISSFVRRSGTPLKLTEVPVQSAADFLVKLKDKNLEPLFQIIKKEVVPGSELSGLKAIGFELKNLVQKLQEKQKLLPKVKLDYSEDPLSQILADLDLIARVFIEEPGHLIDPIEIQSFAKGEHPGSADLVSLDFDLSVRVYRALQSATQQLK